MSQGNIVAFVIVANRSGSVDLRGSKFLISTRTSTKCDELLGDAAALPRQNYWRKPHRPQKRPLGNDAIHRRLGRRRRSAIHQCLGCGDSQTRAILTEIANWVDANLAEDPETKGSRVPIIGARIIAVPLSSRPARVSVTLSKSCPKTGWSVSYG